MIWPPPMSICRTGCPAPAQVAPGQENHSDQAGRHQASIAPQQRVQHIRADALVQPSFVAEMDMRELAISRLQVERDRAGGLAGAAADLGQAEVETLREVDADPVFGAGDRVLIGSPEDCTMPGTSSRARRASTSTSKLIGLNSGGCLFGLMAPNTHHTVAMSSVSWPDRILTSASR